MLKVRLDEVNTFVSNLYNQLDVKDLTANAAGAIRSWFLANMSTIGRYSNRDFERFGRLNGSASKQGRQDGWIAVTEEVSEIDHISYGTGILFINGEMQLPTRETTIANSCFRNCDENGEDQIYDERPNVYPGPYYARVLRELIIELPKLAEGEEYDAEDPPPSPGFLWGWIERRTFAQDGGKIGYHNIMRSVGGIEPRTHNGNGTYSVTRPQAYSGVTATFNDSQVYDVDNERHNFPLIIINSAQPESISTMLDQTFNNSDGVRGIPQVAKRRGNYGPKNRMQVSSSDKKKIMEYISPLSTDPTYDKKL